MTYENVLDDVHITADAEFFKDMFNLMSTLVQVEVQFEIRSDGLYQKQLDEAHVGMTIMFIPKTYFKVWKAGKVVKDLRLGVRDVKAILMKLSHGDLIDFSVIEEGKLHVEIQGKRIRQFNLPLIEPEPVEKRIPKVVPQVRIKTTMEGLQYSMEDVNNFLVKAKKKEALGQIAMITTPQGLKIESQTEDNLYSTYAFLNQGWDIMQFMGALNQKIMIALAYGIDIIKSLSSITNIVQLEFSTDFPLRIIAELPLKGVSLDFWLAPRVDIEKAAQIQKEKPEVTKEAFAR